MKTHQILCRHTGEYSYTSRDPYAVWSDGGILQPDGSVRPIDLKAQHDCILSSDDWRAMTVDLWEIREVTLPDWLSPGEWIASCVTWKWTWGMGVEQDWPEAWQRGLANMSSASRLACVKLLKTKNFRSEMRRSFRAQLEQWLETPREERKHDSPFSRRQWHLLIDCHVEREAKRIDMALYRSR